VRALMRTAFAVHFAHGSGGFRIDAVNRSTMLTLSAARALVSCPEEQGLSARGYPKGYANCPSRRVICPDSVFARNRFFRLRFFDNN
jgi:hypothetical protein